MGLFDDLDMMNPHRFDPFTEGLQAIGKGIGTKEVVYQDISFLDFIRQAWRVIEPHTPFVDGWHIHAIADHLVAVTEGQIENLLINIPPRCMKSSLVSVMWQPWAWIRQPHLRWIFSSYDLALSTRDTVKSRDIITSPWYQSLWHSRFSLKKDTNQKAYYANTETGVRIAVSQGSRVTGEGGDIIVNDDPHKAKDAYSPAALENAVNFWKGTMSSRSNDAGNVKRVIVMQRIADADLSGEMLRQGDYVHLCLPMEHSSKLYVNLQKSGAQPKESPLNISDPRTEDGELLWPDRFNADAVAKLRKALGAWSAASQLDQYPTPLGGGIIQEDWIRRWSMPSPNPRPEKIVSYFNFDRMVICLDPRNKVDPDSGSFVCITAWGKIGPDAYLLDCYNERVGYVGTKRAFRTMCQRWPLARARVIEAKAAGPSAIEELKNGTPGEPPMTGIISYDPGSDNKISRLESVSPLFEGGNVYFPADNMFDWVSPMVQQLTTFPRSANDDFVDNCSMGLSYFYGGKDVLQAMKNLTGMK